MSAPEEWMWYEWVAHYDFEIVVVTLGMWLLACLWDMATRHLRGEPSRVSGSE